MVAQGDFHGRRAPYAPISALKRFFERVRDRSTPDRVDHLFLQKLNVAANNEYSLLSALKFLGVLDDSGVPTHAFRLLQTTDRFQETLWHLVTTAYRPVFDQGADRWSHEDLVNYFRYSSSASQAKNAARFFEAVCHMAGHSARDRIEPPEDNGVSEQVEPPPAPATDLELKAPVVPAGGPLDELVLRAKAQLLEKLPAPQPGWSAAEYQAICDSFLALLQTLERH